jgi:hypothetical protein
MLGEWARSRDPQILAKCSGRKEVHDLEKRVRTRSETVRDRDQGHGSEWADGDGRRAEEGVFVWSRGDKE